MGDVLSFRLRPETTESAAADGLVRLTPAQTRAMIGEAVELHLASVERLVAILDNLAGDPDLEDGGDDEPSLGAPEAHDSQLVWLRGTDSDRELDHSPETFS